MKFILYLVFFIAFNKIHIKHFFNLKYLKCNIKVLKILKFFSFSFLLNMKLKFLIAQKKNFSKTNVTQNKNIQ